MVVGGVRCSNVTSNSSAGQRFIITGCYIYYSHLQLKIYSTGQYSAIIIFFTLFFVKHIQNFALTDYMKHLPPLQKPINMLDMFYVVT